MRAVLLFLLVAFSSIAIASPNILIILADDAGWPHFNFVEQWMEGAYPHITRNDIPGMPPPGVDLVTPNLDQLAASSAFFPRGHVTAPVCMPSVRSILSGLNPRNFRTRTRLRPEYERIISQYLGELGYVSMMAGKWWDADPVNIWGFDRQAGIEVGRQTMQPVYDFLQEMVLDDPAHPPFFLWFAPKLPHKPYDVYPAEYDELYPDDLHRQYHAMLTYLDTRVGELLDYLKMHGLYDNTLIFFLSDNGEELPLSKRHNTENGVRTPLLVAGPGVEPQVRDELVSSLDILPTVLSWVGIQTAGIPLDGLDLTPLLDKQETEWRRYQFVDAYGIKTVESRDSDGDWKIYISSGIVRKFFNLELDPFELNNLKLQNLPKMDELETADRQFMARERPENGLD